MCVAAVVMNKLQIHLGASSGSGRLYTLLCNNRPALGSYFDIQGSLSQDKEPLGPQGPGLPRDLAVPTARKGASISGMPLPGRGGSWPAPQTRSPVTRSTSRCLGGRPGGRPGRLSSGWKICAFGFQLLPRLRLSGQLAAAPSPKWPQNEEARKSENGVRATV